LKSQIGEEMPTLNDVASMLYLSPQTLRRRLAAEGKREYREELPDED
jgi:hypothetical protein